MSQPDLARVLRDARPVAPAELRERVRLVAAQATPPPRRLVTWRRVLVVAVPVAAAIVAGVLVTRPSHKAAQPIPHEQNLATDAAPSGAQGRAVAPLQVPSSAKRAQRYTASLQLEVATPAAVSSSTKRAVAIAGTLGGYVASVNVNTGAGSGFADIRLRIPKAQVQEAVRRLSALGRIVGENVSVQDLQAGVDATDRLITRLQRNLAALRAQEQTPAVARRIVALATRIQQLQRNRAAIVRSARYATVDLQLRTRQPAPVTPGRHGPLHGLVAAFRWIGIGAVYALAVGLPFAALAGLLWFVARAWRRRREDSLLSRP
jgi:hypothetical protein